MAPAVATYEPRDPSHTVLYKVVAEHLETFLASLAADPDAKGLPAYVQREFDAYLQCGILAYGFLRLGCDTCPKELLLPFSCKRRGFCPSCAGRRMAQTAAHLVECVIPWVPTRQWVVSVPIPLRYWMAASQELTAQVHTIIRPTIGQYYVNQAVTRGVPRDELQPLVAPQLTVVSAPPRYEAFQRMRGTPTLLGWCPARRWYMKRQEFRDGPAVVSDTSGHRRCCPATGVDQTRMRGAEIIDRTDEIHAMLQRQRAARQRTPSACQRCQPLTKRRVQPLDVRGIDHAFPLRPASERLDACRRTIDNAAFGLDHPPPLVALDDLGDQNMTPRTKSGPSALPRGHGIAKGFPNGPDVRHQAISTDQQGTPCRTALHPRNQPPDQGQVPLLADLTTQPQARLDHHGQPHPHDAALFLHTDLIGLHLPQVTGLFDQVLLHGLPLSPGAGPPIGDGAFIESERRHHGLHGTALGEQGHDEGHGLCRGAQAIECRAFRGAERLVALRAEEALVLARVDTNVAPAGLSSGEARHIRAECRCGVHDDSPLLVVLGSMPRRSMSGPPLPLQPHSTTV